MSPLARPGVGLAAAVLVAACAGAPNASTPASNRIGASGTASSSPAATGTPTASARPTADLPPATDLATAGALKIRAEPFPDFAVVAEGFLYVGGVGDGIAKLDPTGAQVATWTVPGESCAAMDVGFGAVWSGTCGMPGLVRIDIEGDDLTPVEIGGLMPDSEASVGAGEDGVWLTVGVLPRYLVKVDPETGKVVGKHTIPGDSTAVRVGFGGVWVVDIGADVLRRIDPADGSVVATIEVGARPQFLATGEGAVWTMNQADGTISRIDPNTNAVVATIVLGEAVQGGDIATGGGFLWLRGSRTLLFKIDPATNEIVARYGPSGGSGSVAADADAVWVTAHDTRTIWRLPLP